MDATPEQYLKNLAKGDPLAYKWLYENFFTTLCVFARQFRLERMEAEDIVQDVFTRLYENRQQFLTIASLTSFLYTAVRNHALNHIRNEQRRHDRECAYSTSMADDGYFLEEVIRNEVYGQLQQLLDELPEQCRIIFEEVLRGKTSEAIARSLNLSVETVKTQRKKAKKILRERYRMIYSLLQMILTFV